MKSSKYNYYNNIYDAIAGGQGFLPGSSRLIVIGQIDPRKGRGHI